jgi:hypothetical protein
MRCSSTLLKDVAPTASSRESTVDTRLPTAGARHESCRLSREGLILRCPTSGRLLRPFKLSASDGMTVQFADFKQRAPFTAHG